jgi:hypothetical protein
VTADGTGSRSNVVPGPGHVRPTAAARAYCGPAHGQQWPIGREGPPARVELPGGSSMCPYRLVRHPRTGRPARDHRGNYLYVPIVVDGAPDDRAGRPQGLALPDRGGVRAGSVRPGAAPVGGPPAGPDAARAEDAVGADGSPGIDGRGGGTAGAVGGGGRAR